MEKFQQLEDEVQAVRDRLKVGISTSIVVTPMPNTSQTTCIEWTVD